MLFFAVFLVLSSLPSAFSIFCERNVTFVGPWSGGDAWLVTYVGPYQNDRPPHVQVGKTPEVTVGQFACLDNIHTVGKSAIEFDVEGVWK